MDSPRTISFRISAENVEELDAVARNMERDRSYVLNEAVDRYLEENRRLADIVERGREDIRAGRVYAHGDVERMVDGWTARGKRKAG
ncbi:MAG TPA: ribbon-helix-helix protein, CopG family [Terracidiphilus sp.]|jgi:predicted transcriptional regulator|nr:ribbon-helix-helix protein, CopG family [Terracidiphilus sp.]